MKMQLSICRKIRQDGRLRKTLAGTNSNLVFECTNLIDTFRVSWLTTDHSQRFSRTLDVRCPSYFNIIARAVDLIERTRIPRWLRGCGWSVISSETIPRLKREVQEVANEMRGRQLSRGSADADLYVRAAIELNSPSTQFGNGAPRSDSHRPLLDGLQAQRCLCL